MHAGGKKLSWLGGGGFMRIWTDDLVHFGNTEGLEIPFLIMCVHTCIVSENL